MRQCRAGSGNRLSAVTRTRGRPRSEETARVVDRLLDAAEGLLEAHGPTYATERRIAAEAGVTHAMIHYYFGSIDGLMFALVERLSVDVAHAYTALQTDTTWFDDDPTRHLIRVLRDCHYAKPWIVRMVFAEFSQDVSVVSAMFMKRYGARGLGEIRNILDRLVERGIYHRHLDTACAALSMMSILTAPLSLTQLSAEIGIELSDLQQDRWLDYVVALFDAQLRGWQGAAMPTRRRAAKS